jgi:hypothetical protein
MTGHDRMSWDGGMILQSGILRNCAQTYAKINTTRMPRRGLHSTYNDWNRGEFVFAGESGERENSVYGDMADIMFADEETRGFSNAIAGPRSLTFVGP